VTSEFSETCPTCRGRGFLPPLKVCANEKCGREFRWQEGRAKQGQYRTKGVRFCSLQCAAAQVQREYRRRRKAEAQWQAIWEANRLP
jgi:hypothetical protein